MCLSVPLCASLCLSMPLCVTLCLSVSLPLALQLQFSCWGVLLEAIMLEFWVVWPCLPLSTALPWLCPRAEGARAVPVERSSSPNKASQGLGTSLSALPPWCPVPPSPMWSGPNGTQLDFLLPSGPGPLFLSSSLPPLLLSAQPQMALSQSGRSRGTHSSLSFCLPLILCLSLSPSITPSLSLSLSLSS